MMRLAREIAAREQESGGSRITRCRKLYLMTDYERIAKVIHYLDSHYQEQPDLSTLARAAGLSDFHFHRLFARWAGVTPKTFIQFLTAQHAKALLHASRSVMDISFESGLSGPGRLHDLLVSVEGVTPG